MSSQYIQLCSFFGGRLFNFIRLPLCHSLVRQLLYSPKANHHFLSRRSFTLMFIIIASALFASCEKVINVQLNEAEKKYVIEAVVTDQPNSATVTLSQTKNFEDDNSFNGISGAQITIADNNETPVKLTETSAGVYAAPAFTGKPGHIYKLNVIINGQVFTAASTMPSLVPIDSIYVSERNIFGDTRKFATIIYNDPSGKGNAYRYIQSVNGVKEKTIFVRDDDLSDGRTITRTLFYFNGDDSAAMKTGDNLQVEMLCIDYPIYKYWYSLTESSTGDNQSATPANPVTNIEGGALGYFSAHTVQRKTLVVP